MAYLLIDEKDRNLAKLEIISVRLPRWMIYAIDNLVELGLYTDRTEFIRETLRQRLLQIRKELADKKWKKLLDREGVPGI